jgi:hypothetical protein
VTTQTIPHPLERLRLRYPAGLVCTACLTILATRPESYAGSGLTTVQRLAYVCAECRADQTEADRLAAARRANLQRARRPRPAPREGAGFRAAHTGLGSYTGSDGNPLPGVPANRGVAERVNRYSGTPLGDLTRARARLQAIARARRDARRRRHETGALGNRLRQRSFRQRQRPGAAR